LEKIERNCESSTSDGISESIKKIEKETNIDISKQLLNYIDSIKANIVF
jgi:hypothetical protein